MNKYEFIATGYMLYGSTWKTELSYALCLSANSNSVAKIAKGQRNVTEGVKTSIENILERKIRTMNYALEYLRKPTKVAVVKEQFSTLTFDQYGVRQWDAFQGSEVSDYTVEIHGVALEVPEKDIEYISLIIASVAEECFKAQSNAELIRIIPEYFDFGEMDVDLSKCLISHTQAQGESEC